MPTVSMASSSSTRTPSPVPPTAPHPFSGAANGSAPLNHTPQQFQLIAHLSLLVMVAAVALSFAARLLGVRYVFRMMRPVGCLRPAIRTCSLRAPPVC